MSRRPITIRVPEEIVDQLNRLSRKSGMTKQDLVTQALIVKLQSHRTSDQGIAIVGRKLDRMSKWLEEILIAAGFYEPDDPMSEAERDKWGDS